MALNWYAIHTRSKHEDMVYKRLLYFKLNTFLPKIYVWSKRRNLRKKIKKPLFPGYLFIQCQDDYKEFLKVLQIPGVVRILGYNGKPSSISEEVIFSLRRIIEEEVEIDPYPCLKIGQKVRVVRGPLKDIVGILIQKKKKDRLVIQVDLLGQGVSVEIDCEDIEPYN